MHLRNPAPGSVRADGDGLRLLGNAYTLSDVANPAFLGFRQRDLAHELDVSFAFRPERNGEEAGVSIFYKYDAHIDVYIAREGGETCLCLRKAVGDITHIAARLPWDSENVRIRFRGDKLTYKIYTVIGGAEIYLGEALTRYVSTEAHELGFTGTFYALYATGNGVPCGKEARFTAFCYRGLDGSGSCSR